MQEIFIKRHIDKRKILIGIIIAACIALYTYSYLRVPRVTQILQTSITTLTPQLLFEKQPIVIEEGIVDPTALIGTVFKYLAFDFFGKPQIQVATSGVSLQQTQHRYTILTCAYGGEVDIFHPKYTAVIKTSNAQFITIRLAAHQPLILPKHWWFQIKANNNGPCKVIRITGI